jgi:hypothetical protein
VALSQLSFTCFDGPLPPWWLLVFDVKQILGQICWPNITMHFSVITASQTSP